MFFCDDINAMRYGFWSASGKSAAIHPGREEI